MNLDLCDKRKAILDQSGHLLVLGGPGSGKTTVALLKAQRRSKLLRPGQEILFLSFSRAAIRQIVARCRQVLSIEERRLIEVKTYHSFCLDQLETHGRLNNGKTATFLFPGDERLRRARFSGNWEVERRRLAESEGLVCFDLFAPLTADILARHSGVRDLVADKYPMIIVDEFQDTDNDQWRIVQELGTTSEILCLVDPDQRIFEYRASVDPKRIEQLRSVMTPAEFDLGEENHRSPNGGILAFADAVLKNKVPLPQSSDVKIVAYYPNAFATTVHAAAVWTFSKLRKDGFADPSVAVLCRSNPLVAQLSDALNEEHVYNGTPLRPMSHEVVWDAELSIAAAVVVGSILEWPATPKRVALRRTLEATAAYYEMKNADKPSNAAAVMANKLVEAATRVGNDELPRTKPAKDLASAFDAGLNLVGDIVPDWLSARNVLRDIDALKELYRNARLIRLLRATDALGAGLSNAWLAAGSYQDASVMVRWVLERERLVSADREPQGCVVMTMHKSKGKEFDGVVLVEGKFASRFFDDSEDPPHERSRRLLRVAITRARSLVTIVRPHGADPLTFQ